MSRCQSPPGAVVPCLMVWNRVSICGESMSETFTKRVLRVKTQSDPNQQNLRYRLYRTDTIKPQNKHPEPAEKMCITVCCPSVVSREVGNQAGSSWEAFVVKFGTDFLQNMVKIVSWNTCERVVCDQTLSYTRESGLISTATTCVTSVGHMWVCVTCIYTWYRSRETKHMLFWGHDPDMITE